MAIVRAYWHSPRLALGVLRRGARGALQAIKDDPGHVWATRTEIVRSIVPDAATGVEWHGQAAFLAVLRAHLSPSSRVLEVGVGGARIARDVAGEVGELVCCDAAEAMLAEARENLAGHSNVSFALNRGATLGGLRDGDFDVVYAHDVLFCFELNPALAMLDEIHRVLRPGGVCVASFVTIDKAPAAKAQLEIVRAAAARDRFAASEPRAYTESQVDRMLEVAGLVVTTRSYDDEADEGHEHYIVVAARPDTAASNKSE